MALEELGGGRVFLCLNGNTFANISPYPPPQKKYGDTDLCCAIHNERNVDWGPRMEGFRIPTIWHQTSIPILPLQWIWGRLKY